MVIVKSRFRVSKMEGNLSPAMASGDISDETFLSRSLDSGSDAGAASDGDSGMASDGYDLSELGEPETELCQVGDQSCSIPIKLYELPDLCKVLSLENWNHCLSEEERFALSAYLPDMDQETFAWTLSELFAGKNFHFGSPLATLFGKMKGGLCEPTTVLYRRGLTLLQRHEHYHRLRAYHNSIIGKLGRMRKAWKGCRVYGVEERVSLLNEIHSEGKSAHRNSIGCEMMDMESEDSGEQPFHKKARVSKPSVDSLSPSRGLGLKREKQGKQNPRGILKIESSKGSGKKGYITKNDGYRPSDKLAAKKRLIKPCKKQNLSGRFDRLGSSPYRDEASGSYSGSRPTHGWNMNSDPKVTIASYGAAYLESDGLNNLKARHVEEDQMYSWEDRDHPSVQNGSWVDPSIADELSERKMHVASNNYLQNHEWNSVKGNKWKMVSDLKSGKGKTRFESKLGHENSMRDQSKTKYYRNGTTETELFRKSPTEHQTEKDSESVSSDEDREDVNSTHPAKKGSYSEHRSGVPKNYIELERKDASELHFSVRGIYSPAFEEESHGIKEKKSKTKKSKDSYGFNLEKKGKAHHHKEKKQPKSEAKNYLVEKKKKDTFTLDDGLLEAGDVYYEHESSSVEKRYAETREAKMDSEENNVIPLTVCNTTITKKWKGKSDSGLLDQPDDSVFLQSSPNNQIVDDQIIMKKHRKNMETGSGPLIAGFSNPPVSVKERADKELDKKPDKPFAIITPSVHSGFSFSIVHLLSAVRKAMVTLMEDGGSLQIKTERNHRKSNYFGREDQKSHIQVEEGGKQSLSQDTRELNMDEHSGVSILPDLTVREIVSRVKSNPLDPCILETQEPLQDLVRGALKVFSTKTGSLAAKGWKALVLYEKSRKTWSWVGPVCTDICDDSVEEETSPEAWGIPHKMLLKLVDAFANWLKSGQDTLRQIGSLPPPPEMPSFMNERERFRELKVQKSMNTIGPNTDEIRAYFRKEEFLRYSVPDRAFSYTAMDGKKSIVAPLRRGGGKPTSKARDHFMLKSDRPPHVTILCLVRDAASRLPGSIGTRADVCTLIRDSQYVVEDVTDAQVNQVVSGALDRLHYERDPCVQFDGDRKLWVYLHRDREEEDFEDDGTSSTKKWKRQRKDGPERSDLGAANDINQNITNGDHITGGSSPPARVDKNAEELVYDDLRPNPGGWDVIGMKHLRENKLLCQENSTNEDFEDEAFSRERPVGLLGANFF